ncbi:N-acetylmuramoyl-L-alanine amidase, partial [Streptomyces sp. TRM76130]|nr:N-acetylmuramoyl-L-alanine amidase [Streptomyces sp. TRM76130]
MHGFCASSIGVTCAVALALPLVPPAESGTPAPTPAAAPAPAPAPAPAAAPAAHGEAAVSGSTQSLPLRALAQDRSADPATPAGPAVRGVPRREVRPFSLVGVVWDDPDRELHGSVRVRVRDTATGAWSGWQE